MPLSQFCKSFVPLVTSQCEWTACLVQKSNQGQYERIRHIKGKKKNCFKMQSMIAGSYTNICPETYKMQNVLHCCFTEFVKLHNLPCSVKLCCSQALLSVTSLLHVSKRYDILANKTTQA